MQILLDRYSSQPIYLQIRDRISKLIQVGAMQPGDRLPSIRSLAQSAQVNKLTVIEAYSVLEGDGLINARQGAGYFVSAPSATVGISSVRADAMLNSAQEVAIVETYNDSFFDSYVTSIQAQKQEGTIDFSLGFNLSGDLEDLTRIARRAMTGIADSLCGYELPQGQLNLRKQISQQLVRLGLGASPENIIVTNGSRQGLALAMQYYLKPGDWVIVESPTYFGALTILKELGTRTIGIPMRSDGMNLELLEQYLHNYRPKLIYTISTLHNPTGITTSQAHRQQLLALAEKYNCPILEDNAFEGLNFDTVPAPIKALDRADLVTYLSTFSKTLMPGLRVGYMVVTGEHYPPLLERKLHKDLHVSTVSQAVISEYLASGHFRHHLNHLRNANLYRRNTMLQALEAHMLSEVSWTIPNGGLFLWLRLPDRIQVQSLKSAASAANVLIGCGKAFFPSGQGYQAMRLNFAQKPEDITKGIAILGNLLKTM
jgi:DNA-binding transcriptional MocR family regulator